MMMKVSIEQLPTAVGAAAAAGDRRLHVTIVGQLLLSVSCSYINVRKIH